jgi:hypothetical protein
VLRLARVSRALRHPDNLLLAHSNTCHEQSLANRCSRQFFFLPSTNFNRLAPLLNSPQPATSTFRLDTQRNTPWTRDITDYDRELSSASLAYLPHIVTDKRALYYPSNVAQSPPDRRCTFGQVCRHGSNCHNRPTGGRAFSR